MMMVITLQELKIKGELLGYCPQKGNIYSLCVGKNEEGIKKYAVCHYSTMTKSVMILISYQVTP